jgi:hypothetical protein
MSATGTRIHMAAERGGSAAQNGGEYLQVQPGEPFPAAIEEGVSGGAYYIGHLDGWPRHLFSATAVVTFATQGQSVERTGRSVQVLLGEVEIDGGLFQVAMAQ